MVFTLRTRKETLLCFVILTIAVFLGVGVALHAGTMAGAVIPTVVLGILEWIKRPPGRWVGPVTDEPYETLLLPPGPIPVGKDIKFVEPVELELVPALSDLEILERCLRHRPDGDLPGSVEAIHVHLDGRFEVEYRYRRVSSAFATLRELVDHLKQKESESCSTRP